MSPPQVEVKVSCVGPPQIPLFPLAAILNFRAQVQIVFQKIQIFAMYGF